MRRHLRVAYRMLNVLVPQIILNGARIMPVRGQVIPGVVYLYRAGNSVACKTGIMPPFHHHGRGQRDGIPPLFLPVGAVGSALAVLHVACCLAQSSRRRRPEATRAPTPIPQAPSGPEALSWPYPHAPLRGLCAGSCAAPTGALRPTTPHRLPARTPPCRGHFAPFLSPSHMVVSGVDGPWPHPSQRPSKWRSLASAVLSHVSRLLSGDPGHAHAWAARLA